MHKSINFNLCTKESKMQPVHSFFQIQVTHQHLTDGRMDGWLDGYKRHEIQSQSATPVIVKILTLKLTT